MIYVVFVLFFFTISCFGQETSGLKIDSKQEGRDSSFAVNPPHLLNFESEGMVKGIAATPILTIPFKCTANSYTFIEMRDPKKIEEALVFSIHGDEGRRITLSSAVELRDVEIIDFYPTSTAIVFLVRAAKAAQGTARDQQARERRFYLVETDHEGQHERSIEIPVAYPLFRLGALDSGEFVLSGYDLPEQTLRLLLLDHSGRIVKSIDQPRKMKDKPQADHSDLNSIDGNNEMEANRTMFVSYKDNVLVWRRGTKDPILEISSRGAIREIRLALPHGQQIADLVPSNTWWLIHVEPDAVSDTEAHDLSAASYFEVSPLDGSIVRELRVVGEAANVIACEDKNTYRAFSTDKAGKLIQFLAH